MSGVFGWGGSGVVVFGWLVTLWRWRRGDVFIPASGIWAVGCFLIFISDALTRQPFWAAWQAVCTVVNAWWWWNNRGNRKRRRAVAALGNKARARLAAMAARLRESRPRPVLRPLPQAAP